MSEIAATSSGGAALVLVYLLVLLGAMLGFGFGTRALMRSKGRSGAAGFFLGMFLGVFGLLIAALLPADPGFEAERLRRQMTAMGQPVGYPHAVASPPGAPDNSWTQPMSAVEFRVPTQAAGVSRADNPLTAVLLYVVAGAVALSSLFWWALIIWASRRNWWGTGDMFWFVGPDVGVFAQLVVLASIVLAILAVVRRSTTLVALALAARLVTAGGGLGRFVLRSSSEWAVPALLGDIVVIFAIVGFAVMVVASARSSFQFSALGLMATIAGVAGAIVALVNAISRGRYFVGPVLAFVAVPVLVVAVGCIVRSRLALAFATAYGVLSIEQALRFGRNPWLEWHNYGSEMGNWGKLVAGTWLTNLWTLAVSLLTVVALHHLWSLRSTAEVASGSMSEPPSSPMHLR